MEQGEIVIVEWLGTLVEFGVALLLLLLSSLVEEILLDDGKDKEEPPPPMSWWRGLGSIVARGRRESL